MCSSVDLPAPEGPTSATACPGQMSAEAPFEHGDLARPLMEGAHQPVEPQARAMHALAHVSHGLQLLGQGLHAVAHS